MSKQYTFKTTRATEWMEEYLDALPPSDRSRFIREALADKLGMSDKMRYFATMPENVSQKPTWSSTVPQGHYPVTPTVSHEYDKIKVIENGNQVLPKVMDEPIDEPVFEAKEINLDDKLNNLFG